MWHRYGTETPESSGDVHGFSVAEVPIFRVLLDRHSRSGRGGRRFKSYHSDQQIQALLPSSHRRLAQIWHGNDFRAGGRIPMDFDITTVRKLTALRNKPGLPFHLKQQLTNIINTAENINREQTDMRYREQLIASFKKQWAEYIVERDRIAN